MTSRDRGGDNSSRASQRGNNGNQEARDMGETGQHEETMGKVAGAGSGGQKRNSVENGDRGVGNNTDGVVGSGGDEGLGTRDNG